MKVKPMNVFQVNRIIKSIKQPTKKNLLNDVIPGKIRYKIAEAHAVKSLVKSLKNLDKKG